MHKRFYKQQQKKRVYSVSLSRAGSARVQLVFIEWAVILKISILPHSFLADKTPGNILPVRPSRSVNKR